MFLQNIIRRRKMLTTLFILRVFVIKHSWVVKPIFDNMNICKNDQQCDTKHIIFIYTSILVPE